MDIKYRTEGSSCITRCPFGMINHQGKGAIKVGSVSCIFCKYFMDKDTENNIVKCGCKMEERAFKLSLEKAKEWYNGSSQDLKRIALEVYTEEELTKKELPNSWEEYYKQLPIGRKNELAENILNIKVINNKLASLFQLELLRDCYRQGWKPNWHSVDRKYCIQLDNNRVEKTSVSYISSFLSFQSQEIRDKFLENFKDLIEEAGDLI